MKFPHWLTLLFIAFKLAGVISWSWWLVLLPMILYIPVGYLVGWLQEWAEDREFGKASK